ncbi:MAG: calcium-binding protein, partial [Cyanobacteria bacterium P01_D01_bin.123]
IDGGAGNDSITSGNNKDTLLGCAGNDTLSSGNGNDSLEGGTGDDLLDGGHNDDVLHGGVGNDTLHGGRNHDTYLFGRGDGHDVIDDVLSGNSPANGFDKLVFDADIAQSELSWQLDALNNLTFFIDGAPDDSITIREMNNTYQRIEQFTVEGNLLSLNDVLANVSGFGSSGSDTLSWTTSAIAIDGGAGNDSITSGNNKDTLRGGVGSDQLIGNQGNDILIGADTHNYGVNDVDTLQGSAGSDLYVIGESGKLYYDDGISGTAGLNDYAHIQTFNTAHDFIQLEGDAQNYVLGTSPIASVSGTAIYLNHQDTNELVAVVEGVNAMDLNATYFSYV